MKLLDYSYHQNYYKLIGIDLSRQTNTSINQQINKLINKKINQQKKKTVVRQCFLSVKSSKKLFSLHSLVATE